MALEIRVDRCGVWAGDGLELRLFDREIGRYGARVDSLTLTTVETQGVYMPPTAVLSFTCGQQFMDELWRAGLRPSEGSGSAGSLAATERHLADMRAMAFSALKVAKP